MYTHIHAPFLENRFGAARRQKRRQGSQATCQEIPYLKGRSLI